MKKISLLFALVASFTFTLAAQTVLTEADYARAEKMLGYGTAPLVDRNGVRPVFMPDGRFYYQALTATGSEYVLIDPSNGARKNAPTLAELGVTPSAAGAGFTGRRGVGNEVRSPDGKLSAYIKDWNLWVKDTATNKETQLTTDGVKDFGYATNNAGWVHSDRPVMLWSPDSKRIATFQQDQRNVSDMYLASTEVGAPKLEAWKYPLPRDKEIVKISRVIIDVATAKVTRLKMAPDDHRSTLCDDISCGGSFDDNDWSPDGTKLAFVSSSRDHKSAKFRIADAATGDVRDVFEEKVATQYESGQGAVNWRFLPATNEAIWYSERDDWGHLYMYNTTTGQPKWQITKGNFVVTRVTKVDPAAKVIFFEANGREPGDPYFSHFYRIDFDGKNLKLLTPEDGNHAVTASPDGKYFVDNYSKPDVPVTAVLRDVKGNKIADLEKGDVTRLAATGWKPATPITVKSRDGKWDLYGVMFTPSNLDPNKKYPVVNYIYPGPQGGGVGSRSFSASRGPDHNALAELGFIVVVIDGTCNPDRSKSFHDACYGNMADNTLEDQISGLKQLAQKYPYMDLTRVGIWGHSGGGFATASAMFRYPDFYKVGISESGNHDNRVYEDDWGERYIGLINGDNYEKQANQVYAKNLKGHLLLAHGTMDDNVPPYNTLLVVQELIKANKDFDLIMIPNARHGYGTASNYMMRRRWDYFVRYLMGATPPSNYELKPKTDPRTAR